jgi:hypothetical protein
MTQSQHEKVIEKWAAIFGSTQSSDKSNWLEEYSQAHLNNQLDQFSHLGLTQSDEFPSLLPIAHHVAAQTIGLNLVSVKPLGGNSKEEIERIKKEVLSENRDRKIDAVTKDKQYKEMTIEDHPEWGKGGPSGQLFYIDYKYDSNSMSAEKCNPKNTNHRKAKKKRKRK